MSRTPVDPKLIRNPQEEKKNAEKFDKVQNFFEPYFKKFFPLLPVGGILSLKDKDIQFKTLLRRILGGWVELFRQIMEQAQPFRQFSLNRNMLPEEICFASSSLPKDKKRDYQEIMNKFYQGFEQYELAPNDICEFLSLVEKNILQNTSSLDHVILELPFNLEVSLRAGLVRQQ